MKSKIIGNLVTPYRVIEKGEAVFEKGKIIFCGEKYSGDTDKTYDFSGFYVAPGFVDIHTHGGGGFDFMDGDEDSFIGAASLHAKHGTTTLLPTSTASTDDDLFAFLDAFNKIKNIEHNGAFMPGVHLEGPFFADSQKGAQPPERFKLPSIEYAKKVLDFCPDVLRWSSAAELDGGYELGRYLYDRGVLASIAHSDAILEEAIKAYESGYTHLTHFYSGMSALKRVNSYRFPGLIDAGYMHDDFTVEIIADGCHLPASLLKYIYRAKGADKVALVTDSMSAAGVDTDRAILGGRKNGFVAIVEDGVAKLQDRSAFAGSVATADRLVRNMLKYADCGICDAVKMMTKTPAKIMGFKYKGQLTEGYDADITVFDDNVNVYMTVVGGKVVYLN